MTRTETIKIRVSEAEHRKLKAVAGQRGVSAFLRLQALGVDKRQAQREQLTIIAELTRVRNILNQIARNCERRPGPDQLEIVTHLVRLERELLSFNTR